MTIDELCNYFNIIKKNKTNAIVNIGSVYSKPSKVIVEEKENTYYLIFEDDEIVRLLQGHKEYEVNPIHFEVSQNNGALCTCYGGNHIEIKWI